MKREAGFNRAADGVSGVGEPCRWQVRSPTEYLGGVQVNKRAQSPCFWKSQLGFPYLIYTP